MSNEPEKFEPTMAVDKDQYILSLDERAQDTLSYAAVVRDEKETKQKILTEAMKEYNNLLEQYFSDAADYDNLINVHIPDYIERTITTLLNN